MLYKDLKANILQETVYKFKDGWLAEVTAEEIS